ncbi:MAG: hypothetical protein F6J94_20215 [Moorea sp. SIO1F2]|uniref:hypothetical protein n=1 Tax=Moorena sp. SIO1F2 TaxID=2607819 RepID=UPI0013BC47FE|nr:hypothetical protein [Moorena sp. SIO1F2]NET84154.1 hypothetical protein [Moorena sp. SIO1F2]
MWEVWEVWGDGEMGRWGDGESEVLGSREREGSVGSVGGVGRWGDGEMGRWGDGEMGSQNYDKNGYNYPEFLDSVILK